MCETQLAFAVGQCMRAAGEYLLSRTTYIEPNCKNFETPVWILISKGIMNVFIRY